ncbi:MAG: proprotein convertase P-domain-containing protein [Pseudomonadota bacterium]
MALKSILMFLCITAVVVAACAEAEDSPLDYYTDLPGDAPYEWYDWVEIEADAAPDEGDIADLAAEDPMEDPAADPVEDPLEDAAVDPVPDPVEDPAPDPEPDPDLELIPDPEPDPELIPDPEPDPELIPDPEPDPDLVPDPEPDPDLVTDPDLEPELPPDWDMPVCGTGTTIPDCRAFPPDCSSAFYTDYATFAALGNARVMLLEIDIPDRWFLFVRLPFDDLEVSLQSPSGTSRMFWGRFYGGHSWQTNWDFNASWQIPVFWDEPVGGTWTLFIQDTEFSGQTTELVSWCLTPLNPDAHASVDPGASLRSCYSSSRSIPDYCYGDPPDPCTTHPVQIEMQVTEFVKLTPPSAVPDLTLNITHTDPSDLEIILTSADGRDVTVWNRSPGPIPSTIPLSSLPGIWMTGRWALRLVDHEEGGTGTIYEWCVEAN